MLYKLNENTFEERETERLISEISLLKRRPVSDNELHDLIEIFDITENIRIINTIAIIFSMCEREIVVDYLVKKIEALKHTKYISTLIYACSEFDCSEYLLFFVDIFVNGSYSSMIESFSVIAEMRSPIDSGQKDSAIRLIERSTREKKLDTEGQYYFHEVVHLIRSMMKKHP